MSEPNIRLALPQDARQLMEIYAPYVEKTAISFETAPPTATAMLRRRDEIVQRYPYLVAEQDNGLLGFAYAHPFVGRAAYDWSVETTIYLRMDARGKGMGGKLSRRLEDILTRTSATRSSARSMTAATSSAAGTTWSGWRKSSASTRRPSRPFVPSPRSARTFVSENDLQSHHHRARISDRKAQGKRFLSNETQILKQIRTCGVPSGAPLSLCSRLHPERSLIDAVPKHPDEVPRRPPAALHHQFRRHGGLQLLPRRRGAR